MKVLEVFFLKGFVGISTGLKTRNIYLNLWNLVWSEINYLFRLVKGTLFRPFATQWLGTGLGECHTELITVTLYEASGFECGPGERLSTLVL